MAHVVVDSPFGDEDITEVPLRDAPLARVLAQVRFPRLASLAAGDDAANAYASAMGRQYPILNEQREMGLTISPEGVTPTQGTARVWQLRSADQQWQVSFADAFLAVDTAAYRSREEFAARVVDAWRVFVEVVAPPFIERIGVRYINRVVDDVLLSELPALVRTEALGGLSAALPSGVKLAHSMHESLYQFDELNGLQARWGLLPAGASLDPTLPAVPTVSWVLDLDAFRMGQAPVDAAEVGAQVEHLAERAYRYFRWVTTPQFLTRFGGDV